MDLYDYDLNYYKTLNYNNLNYRECIKNIN